jgi:hypothetical protein
MGGDIDQRAFEPLGVSMAELEVAEFLQVVVQQPGMVEGRLQDQRLAAGDGRGDRPLRGGQSRSRRSRQP